MKQFLHANLFSTGLGIVLAFVVSLLDLDVSGNDTLSVLALSGIGISVTTMFGFTGSLGFIGVLIISQLSMGTLQNVGVGHHFTAVTSVVLFSCLFVPIFTGILADQRRFLAFRSRFQIRESRKYIKQLEDRVAEFNSTKEGFQAQMFSMYTTPAEVTASFGHLIRAETTEEGMVEIGKTIGKVIPDTAPMIYLVTDDFYRKVSGKVTTDTEVPDFIARTSVPDYPCIAHSIRKKKLDWKYVFTPSGKREVEVCVPFIDQHEEVWGFAYIPVLSFLNCNLVYFNFLKQIPILADSVKSRVERKEMPGGQRQIMEYTEFRRRITEELARSRDSKQEFAIVKITLDENQADASILFNWRILGFKILQSLRGHDLVSNGEDAFRQYACIFRDPGFVEQEMIPRLTQTITRFAEDKKIDLLSMISVEVGGYHPEAEQIEDFFNNNDRLSA